MNLPLVDHAVHVGRLAPIARLERTDDSKTAQTAQTDQRIETTGEFGTSLDPKLTGPYQKLTRGTAQQPNPGMRVIGAPIDSAHARPSDGALPP